MFNIIKKKGYVIHETEQRYMICKILNEYETIDEANKDLARLLTKKTNEEELLKDYSKKPL